MTIEIRVPTLGESVTEATVARWLKQPGETITRDEPIVELETDKVTLEVPAPAAATLGEIRAGEGTNVPVGAVVVSQSRMLSRRASDPRLLRSRSRRLSRLLFRRANSLVRNPRLQQYRRPSGKPGCA